MSNPVTITATLPTLTPAHLAALFWEMDSKEQGLFFDELASLVLATPAPYTREIGSMIGLVYQLYEAAKDATPAGRDAMSRFGEYGTELFYPTKADSIRRVRGHEKELNRLDEQLIHCIEALRKIATASPNEYDFRGVAEIALDSLGIPVRVET